MGILSDIAAESDYTPEQFLQSKLANNTPFDEFGDYYAEKYKIPRMLTRPEYEAKRAQMNRLPDAVARERARREGESTGDTLARNIITKAMPYGSSIIGFIDSERIKDATNRINAGEGDNSDYATVARRQVQEEIDKNESTGAAIGKAAFHVPALVGEMGVGGKALGVIGRGLGFGGKAGEVAAAAQPFWKSTAIASAKGAASTPFVPASYLEQASQRSAQNGGEWNDFKNLGPAVGMALSQNAVLGTLQGGFKSAPITWAGRVGAKTGAAVPEQIAADTINGMVVEGVLGQKGGYGLSGVNLGSGEGGEFWKAKTDDEKRQANKQAWTTLATFGMFSAMHGKYVPGKTKFLDGGVEELAKSYEASGMKPQEAQEAARQKTAEIITQTIKDLETPKALPEQQPIKPAVPDPRIEEAAKQPDLTIQDLGKRHSRLQIEEAQLRQMLSQNPASTIIADRLESNQRQLADVTKQMAEFRKNPVEQKIADSVQKIVEEAKPAEQPEAVEKPQTRQEQLRRLADIQDSKQKLMDWMKRFLNPQQGDISHPQELHDILTKGDLAHDEASLKALKDVQERDSGVDSIGINIHPISKKVEVVPNAKTMRAKEFLEEFPSVSVSVKHPRSSLLPLEKLQETERDANRNNLNINAAGGPEGHKIGDTVPPTYFDGWKTINGPEGNVIYKWRDVNGVGEVTMYLARKNGNYEPYGDISYLKGDARDKMMGEYRTKMNQDKDWKYLQITRDVGADKVEQLARDVVGLKTEAAPPEPATGENVAYPQLKAVHDAIDAQADLPPEIKVEYKDSMTRLHESLPTAAVEAMHKNAPKIRFFKDKQAIRDAVLAENPEADKTGKLMNNVGVYRSAKGELWLNGGGSGKGRIFEGEHGATGKAYEIHAHESGHAVDGRGKVYSSTPEWLAATKEFEGGKLSNYAEQPKFGSHESFAEFFRLVHGSEVPLKTIEGKFPQATKFFKDNGLWPSGKRSTPGVTKMPEVFDTRIPLGEDHIDAKIGTQSQPWVGKPKKTQEEIDATVSAEEQAYAERLLAGEVGERQQFPVGKDRLEEQRMKKIAEMQAGLAELRAKQKQIPGEPVTKADRDLVKQIQKMEQDLAEAQDAELAPIPGGETYADYILGKDRQGVIDLNPKGALADIVGGGTREKIRRNILEMVDASTPEGRRLYRKVEQLTRLDNIGKRVVSLEELAPTMVQSGDMVVPRGGLDTSGQDAIVHLLDLIVKGKPMEGSGAEYRNRELQEARKMRDDLREFETTPPEKIPDEELGPIAEEAKGPMPKEMFFSTSPYGPSAKSGATARDYNTPAMVEVVSDIQQLPGVNATIGTVPYSANAQNAQAIANTRSGTIITDKWSSSDPRVWMEDASHILAGRKMLYENGIEIDPAKLPQDVRDGLASFDGGRHTWGNNQVTSKTMMEGLGQWAVRRMTGDLVNLTPAERAASDWAEQQYAPVKKQLDAIKDKYLKNATANSLDRGVVGSKPVSVATKTWDKILEWYDAFRRNYDKSAQVVTTMYRDAKSRGNKAAMDALTKAARWISVHNDQAVSRLANEIEMKGGFEFDAQGRRVYADTKLGDIMTGLAPELVTLHSRMGKSASKLLIKGIRERLFGDNSDTTDFDTFMAANHVTDEGAKFEAYNLAAQQYAAMPMGPAKQAAKQALDAMPKGFDPVEAVGADVYSIMKQQIAEFQKDPAVYQQLRDAHRKYVDVSNSLIKMAADKEIGLMNPEFKDRLIDKYEWYAPLGRIKQYQKQGQPNYLMGRKGSDEQIKAPMVVLKERIQSMAVKINQQMRIKGILDALGLGQMGHWGDFYEVKDLTAEGKRKLQDIDDAYRRGDITEAWRLEDLSTKDDYLYKPWVEGGDNVLPIRGPDGNPTTVKIFDKQLYNLMASRQTEASQAAKAIEWVSQWLPVKAPSKAVTFAASGGNAAFQMRNIPLDAWSAARQTKFSANPITMAKEFFEKLGNMFRAEYEILAGKDASSKADRFMLDTFGRGMKALPFSQGRPSSAYEGVAANRGVAEKTANAFTWFKKLLNVAGAGEMGPRMREMYKYLETQGYSRDFIEAELKRHPDRDPVPYDVLVDAAFYGQEVTGNFGEKGVIMKEIGKAAPFLTAGIAGVRSSLKTARDNPKRFAAFAAMALGLRLLHWYMFKDEEWYKNLNPNDKYQEFPIPINGVPYTIPGFKSRDADVPIGSLTVATLDQMRNQDAKMKDAIDLSMRSMLPGITGEIASNTMKGDISTGGVKAGASIFGPAASAGADIATNQSWMGRPIVPRRDQELPDDEKLTRYKLPYFLGQMTANRSNAVGNMLDGDVQSKDAIKLIFGGMGTREVRPNKSVNDLYQRVDELKETSSREKQRGRTLTPTQANELSRLERAAKAITALSEKARGETRSNGVLLSKRQVSDEEKRAIAAQQLKIARDALGRR